MNPLVCYTPRTLVFVYPVRSLLPAMLSVLLPWLALWDDSPPYEPVIVCVLFFRFWGV